MAVRFGQTVKAPDLAALGVAAADRVSGLYDDFMGGYTGTQKAMEGNEIRGARRSLADLGGASGGDYSASAQKLLAAGDIRGAQALADLGLAQEDRAFRQQRAIAEDSYRQQSLGLQRDQLSSRAPETTTTYDPLSGGAQTSAWNPATRSFEPIGGVKQAPARPLPSTTVNSLAGAGASYADNKRLSSGFEDKFGGQPLIGEWANLYGRTVAPDGSDSANQASWWQDYQTQKNKTRNDLFGSALTATEKGEFEKADINPGMSPGAIRKNLERQQNAATRAAKKLADYYTKVGYEPDQIEAAIGVPLSELGISTGNRPAAGQQQAPMVPAAAPAEVYSGARPSVMGAPPAQAAPYTAPLSSPESPTGKNTDRMPQGTPQQRAAAVVQSAPPGTIVVQGGVRYQKQPDGSFVEVP